MLGIDDLGAVMGVLSRDCAIYPHETRSHASGHMPCTAGVAWTLVGKKQQPYGQVLLVQSYVRHIVSVYPVVSGLQAGRIDGLWCLRGDVCSL